MATAKLQSFSRFWVFNQFRAANSGMPWYFCTRLTSSISTACSVAFMWVRALLAFPMLLPQIVGLYSTGSATPSPSATRSTL